MTEFLVANMADVNLMDRFGHVPLDDAIAAGHVQVATLLLRSSASPNEEVVAERLRVAARTGDMVELKFLIDMDVSLNVQDYSGRTPLHSQCRRGRRAPCSS